MTVAQWVGHHMIQLLATTAVILVPLWVIIHSHFRLLHKQLEDLIELTQQLVLKNNNTK